MIMEVKVVSRDNIKPSSPTPHHHRTFKLSLLDQLIPAPYAPLVFFYPNEDGATNLQVLKRLQVLKKSLSETLTRFYPLAGKIEDDLTIDCNDEGACYMEAEVNCCLADFLSQPDVQVIHRFLPCETSFKGSVAGTHVTNIQVNIFECGGIAIGLCISHKILDGAALSTFVKGWSATACGSKEVVYPDFIATSLFPTNDLWLRDSSIAMWGSLFKIGKCTTRRFAFDASAIANLKAKAVSNSVQNPTRVEAVSAFIWKCAMAASEETRGFTRPSLLSHVVNLRRRTIPPLMENSIGNLIWIASAHCKARYDELGLKGLVGKVREGISKINSDFIKKLRGDERSNVICKSLKMMGEPGSKDGGVDYFGFTSWCKLGFYEADFGWGKPIWVSGVGSADSVFLNLIILMETRSGDGIEAWVTLDEQEMAILQRDMELLTFASLDPSPLKLGKIEDDLTIDCNDVGAHYVEAEVNCRLPDFLCQPDLQVIHLFLPCKTSFKGSVAGAPVTNIQVNIFECGGIAIGLCISHKILDGAALSTFVKGWSATACGSKEVVYPDFIATSLFPTNDLWLRDSSIVMWGSLFKIGKCTTRRFAFDASAITTLKVKAASNSVQNPTQVEAVSAFIWKCAMAASEETHGFPKPSLLSHVVNLRRRTMPPLTEHSIGNLIWIARAQCTARHDQLGLQGLVGQVREGISKINNDFIKKLRGNEGSNVICKSLKMIEGPGSKEGVDYFGFTSWCKLGFYEADLGWGKPLWVSGVGCSGGSVFLNLIILMETRSGNGIKAWVTLDEWLY